MDVVEFDRLSTFEGVQAWTTYRSLRLEFFGVGDFLESGKLGLPVKLKEF